MIHFSVTLLALLLVAFSPFGHTECPENIKLDLGVNCTSIITDLEMAPRVGRPLLFRDLWELDSGGVHPPIRLPNRRIQQLEIESMWGLGEGETIISDPRWDYSELQPELQAISRLLAREAAMAKNAAGWD